MLETKMPLESDIFDKQGLGCWFSIGTILYPKDFFENLWAILIATMIGGVAGI